MLIQDHEEIIKQYTDGKKILLDDIRTIIVQTGTHATARIIGEKPQCISNIKAGKYISYDKLVKIAKKLEK